MTTEKNKNHKIINFVRSELKRQKKSIPEFCEEINISKSIIYNWSFNNDLKTSFFQRNLNFLDKVLNLLGYELQIQKKETSKFNSTKKITQAPTVHFLNR